MIVADGGLLPSQCKENRPMCDYCAHRGLQCEWPKVASVKKRDKVEPTLVKDREDAAEATNMAMPIMPYTFQQDAPIFTIQDFKLFNYFIQGAYPRHPSDNDSVWKHEIPCLATDVSFQNHCCTTAITETADFH